MFETISALLLRQSKRSSLRMEMPTKSLAFDQPVDSRNRCGVVCVEHGVFHFHSHGMLGKKWWVVYGLLWSTSVWNSLVISTSSSNVHLAGDYDFYKSFIFNLSFFNPRYEHQVVFTILGLLDILDPSNFTLAYIL